METFARLTTTSQRGIPIVLCPRNNIARTFFGGGGRGFLGWGIWSFAHLPVTNSVVGHMVDKQGK